MFGHFPENLGGGNSASDAPLDLLSDTIRQTLHTSTWTPNYSTNEVKADATNELSTANGYTALGVTLASKTYVASALVTTFDAADTSWTFTGAVTFRHAPLWDDTSTTPVDALIMNFDTGGDQTLNGVTAAFQFNASGVFAFTVS
jgi:hypothetical protein